MLFLLLIYLIKNNFPLFFLFFSFINFFYKILLNKFIFLDFFFKIFTNDCILHLYNFFWTQSWCLIFFFFVIFVLTFVFCMYSGLTFFLLSLVLIFYLLELQPYFLSNFACFYFNNFFNENNFFLTNNLNKYHPYFLYSSVIFFIFFYFTSFYFTKKFLKLKNFFPFIILFFNGFALFLGAWWAVQEGSWGGWWNWDSSETLGLIIFLVSAYTFHQISCKFFNYFTEITFYFLNFYLFFVFYFLIQLNFDMTSHNFGIKFFFFFNNNLFLIETLYAVYFFTLCAIYNYFSFYFNFLNYLRKQNFFLFSTFGYTRIFPFLAIVCFFAAIVYSGFFSLFTSFFYNFFLITLFNKEAYVFSLFLFFFLLSALVVFFFSNKFFFLIVFFSNKFFFFLLYSKLFSFFALTHYSLFLLINNFFFINNFNYTVVESIAANVDKFSEIFYFWQSFAIFSLNSFLVETSSSYFFNSFVNLNSWNLNNLFIHSLNNFFFFFNSISNFSTFFFLNFDYTAFALLIENKFSNFLFLNYLFFSTICFFLLMF